MRNESIPLGKTRLLLLLIPIMIVVIFIVALIYPHQQAPAPITYNTLQVSPLQKTYPGITSQSELDKQNNLTKSNTESNGLIVNTSKSPINIRPNQIITQDGKTIFERIILPENPDVLGYAKITDITKYQGIPDITISGSKFYGPFINTLIFARKGFALIGNQKTDEVYEMHIFTPMSAEQYIKLYGSDLNPISPVPGKE